MHGGSPGTRRLPRRSRRAHRDNAVRAQCGHLGIAPARLSNSRGVKLRRAGGEEAGGVGADERGLPRGPGESVRGDGEVEGSGGGAEAGEGGRTEEGCGLELRGTCGVEWIAQGVRHKSLGKGGGKAADEVRGVAIGESREEGDAA